MSGGSSANNSWTILTPETVPVTLKPLAEETEQHEESLTSAAGSEVNQLVERSHVEGHLVSEDKTAELSGDTSMEQPTTDASVLTSSEVSVSFVPDSDVPIHSEGQRASPEQSSPDLPDSFSDSYTHVIPSSDEPATSLLSTETLGGGQFTHEEERFAEEETTHLLNGEELQQEGKESDLSPGTTDLGKQAVYLVDQLVLDLFSIWARRLSGEAVVDSPVDSEVGEERTEKTGEEEEPEVRRRRSLLATLERIGRSEEEEEGEEEFQLPRREEESGFSLNKCILGAVILLGLGTIFFSGIFMDLDEESDYATRELKDSEIPGKQEWLNPEVPPSAIDAESKEILNKLAKGNQQISMLQAQLEAQKEELKVAKGQAAEGAKEQLWWEEVEKENSRLKTEMASFTVLQKENERMKRELESVPALQKELETLRSTVTELKLSSALNEAAEATVKPVTSPPSGQPEDTRQATDGTAQKQARKPWSEQKEKKKDWKKDKYDIGEIKESKGREKSDWTYGEKKDHKEIGKSERKKGKHEQEKFDKDKKDNQKSHGDETEKWTEKEKSRRGDEGKPWKAREGKKEWVEKSERKLKEEKDRIKGKHEQVKEGKQWRSKEKEDWKGGNEQGERHKAKEEWKGEKEWKKMKDGFKESGKEKWEKKDWKEKGEKKEWKKDEWKSKNGKDQGKEWKGRGERKQWEENENYGKNHGKERNGKDERKQWRENERKNKNAKDDEDWRRKDERKEWGNKEEWKRGGQKDKKHNADWKKDRSSSQKHKEEHKFNSNHHHDHHEEQVWVDGKPRHTHRQPSLEQAEYWVQQRGRLQHNLKPPQHCDALESCAQAEGLLPVPLPEFEAVLQTYLAKAEEVGVEASKREELKKLATEFFKDGVFIHDQMKFQDFVEDISDILEHMVEEGENGEEEDSDIEEEMEQFEKEVMKKFSVPGAGEKEERIRGEWRKESGRGRR
ncbi:pre-B-cell leukemia homeobox interacting protein 1b isoform X3 [Mastacembelus armatus]|uniref:pre-B-cell leukemia homeobox interacting protein 1b isoform X3 n=1 Tax=Mastacembelus armatus TaxID=205130 RepID=UPI000E463D38|nr:pre-B-cell leukemia transcription factor-interacting protein 1-like isoform X3 [Mastacembelus armatus]